MNKWNVTKKCFNAAWFYLLHISSNSHLSFFQYSKIQTKFLFRTEFLQPEVNKWNVKKNVFQFRITLYLSDFMEFFSNIWIQKPLNFHQWQNRKWVFRCIALIGRNFAFDLPFPFINFKNILDLKKCRHIGLIIFFFSNIDLFFNIDFWKFCTYTFDISFDIAHLHFQY